VAEERAAAAGLRVLAACRRGYTPAALRLLRAAERLGAPVDLRAADADGATALVWSCSGGGGARAAEASAALRAAFVPVSTAPASDGGEAAGAAAAPIDGGDGGEGDDCFGAVASLLLRLDRIERSRSRSHLLRFSEAKGDWTRYSSQSSCSCLLYTQNTTPNTKKKKDIGHPKTIHPSDLYYFLRPPG